MLNADWETVLLALEDAFQVVYLALNHVGVGLSHLEISPALVGVLVVELLPGRNRNEILVFCLEHASEHVLHSVERGFRVGF